MISSPFSVEIPYYGTVNAGTIDSKVSDVSYARLIPSFLDCNLQLQLKRNGKPNSDRSWCHWESISNYCYTCTAIHVSVISCVHLNIPGNFGPSCKVSRT